MLKYKYIKLNFIIKFRSNNKIFIKIIVFILF